MSPRKLFGDDLFGDGLFGGDPSALGYTVEIAFTTTNPMTEPSVWEDVTAYLRKASTRRGRNHELGKTAAGVATLTLDNLDRRFDPTNTSSPYYPNVKPMRQVRIRAFNGYADYDLFRGFIEDWGQQWGGPAATGQGDATCEVSATDGFKVLALMEMASYRDAVLADKPSLYFPMDEPAGTVFGVNLGDGGDQSGTDVLTYFPDPSSKLVTVAGRADGPFALTALRAAPDFANPTGTGAPAYMPSTDVTASQAPFTIEFWIKPDTLTAAPNYIVSQAPGSYWKLSTNTTGQLLFEYISQRTHGAGWTTITSTANLSPAGGLHHIAVVRDTNTVAFYQDGMLQESVGGLADPYPIPAGISSGGLMWIGSSFDGMLAHLAVYPTALTADQISTHYAATCDRIDTATAGDAIGAILNCVGWPAGSRTIGVGSSTVTVTPSGSALDVIQQIAEDTEHGIVEMTPDGKMTFIGRDVLGVPAAATFGDGGGSEIPYRDLVLAFDDQDLWTEVSVSDAAGGTFLSEDAGAIATYGRRTLSFSTVAATANETAGQAEGLLNRYKAPAVRPSSMSFLGLRSLTQQLTRAIGDRVTIERRPPGGGTVTVDAIIEGINHDIPTDGWPRTTFALAPPDPGFFWLLGDATYSVLGSTTLPGW